MLRGDGPNKKAKHLGIRVRKKTHTTVLKRALDQINAGAINEKGVSGVAASLNISTRHLRRVVKASTGSPPIKLNQAKRLNDAQLMLQKTRLPIIDIAFRCDFASLRQFNDVFKRAFKITPRQMRKKLMVNPRNNITA